MFITISITVFSELLIAYGKYAFMLKYNREKSIYVITWLLADPVTGKSFDYDVQKGCNKHLLINVYGWLILLFIWHSASSNKHCHTLQICRKLVTIFCALYIIILFFHSHTTCIWLCTAKCSSWRTIASEFFATWTFYQFHDCF